MNMIVKLFSALNANQHPGQIALSLVLGMMLGLTPLLAPHNLIIVLLIFVLRVNLAGVMAGLLVFSGFAYILDSVFNLIGGWVLHLEAFQPIFTQWYNQAFWRFIQFNNTLVMGSVAVAYGFAIPAYFLFVVLINKYRKSFMAWIKSSKLYSLFKVAA